MNDEPKTDLNGIAIDKLPVGCLTKAAFRIPKYQRGYRWKIADVTKLLEDLEEFIEKGKAEATKDTKEAVRSFYCLQPLVVTKSKEHPSEWEVVDGQQRLTTLFLIWNVLNVKAPYDLSYDTQDRSKAFLKEIAEKTPEEIINIDFYHIYHAHQKIQNWFKDDEDKKNEFKNLLNDTRRDGRNIRFIWYRIQEGTDTDAPGEVFTRLNDRKIPLTDEELIRALFLCSNGTSKIADGAFQHRLALEWDRIETALQEPDFWGFLSNETPPEGGRIRLLFQLCADENLKDDNHALFDYYHERLAGEQREEPSKVWKEIVACFEQLEEWYRDQELFHLVGYYTTILPRKSSKPLRDLVQTAKSKTKIKFATELRTTIRKALVGDGEALNTFIDELDYRLKKGPIGPTLALFNIATILRNEGVRIRFPFHLYHDTDFGWDIEHVQSQAGDNLDGGDLEITNNRKVWLDACKSELKHDAATPSTDNVQEGAQNEVTENTLRAKQLMVEIDEFTTKPESTVKFPELENKIRQHFGETESTDDEINDIGNLTLLDAPTNRGYGNAPFVVKRTEILKPKRPEGTFILPCTRDLFLKVFSKNAGNLRRWDIKNDGAAHKAAICETLKTFFGE